MSDTFQQLQDLESQYAHLRSQARHAKHSVLSQIDDVIYVIQRASLSGNHNAMVLALEEARMKLPGIQDKLDKPSSYEKVKQRLIDDINPIFDSVDSLLDRYHLRNSQYEHDRDYIIQKLNINSDGVSETIMKKHFDQAKKEILQLESEIKAKYGPKSGSKSASKRISNSKSKSKSKSKSLTKLFSGSISKKVSPAKMDSFKDLYNYNPQTLRQWKPCRGDQERNYKSSRCKKFKFHCPPGQGHSRSNDKCVTLAQYLVYLSKKYKELHKADKLKRKSTKRRKSGSLKRKSGSRKRKSVKRKSKKRKSVSKRKSSSHKSKSRSSSHKKSRSSSHKRKSSSHKSPKPTGRAMRARKPVKYF